MWLEEAGVPTGLRVRIILASHEAAANAVRHANPCSNLKLWAVIDERFLTVEIADTGSWSGEVVDDGDEEHGRGLAMIRDLMAQVKVRTSPEGTTVRMREQLVA
jgi:serine/threonine-protein kinase RsbW